MKTQVRKYISLLLPVSVTLFTIGLMGIWLFLVSKDYETIIKLLFKYSRFPESKLQDLKNEYLSIERFHFLRYALFGLLCLSVIFSYWILRKREAIGRKIEFIGVQLSHNVSSLWKAFRKSVLFSRIVLSLCFLYITGLTLWGTITYPLIYDEVFSYFYFVNKGFLVTVSYYPGPNNHILYLLACNVMDLFFDNPVLIMRLPALFASLVTCAVLLLYFNKRFSALFAVLLVICLYSSYSIFYYSFHGRGYSFALLFFVIDLLCVYEFVKRRAEFYLILFTLVSIGGCYTVPIFVYPLGAFALFLLLFSLIKKDVAAAKKILVVFFVTGLITAILYSPVILLSGLDSIIHNGWVKPLPWNAFIQGYEIYLKELQNHFWEVPHLGWIISLLIFLSGVFALYKMRKTWWILLSVILLVSPFVFLLIQKVYPFMRTLDYLFIVFVFLLTSFLTYIVSFFRGNTRIVVSVVLMAGIVFWSLIKISTETPVANKYYKDLGMVMDEVFESHVSRVYSADEVYTLFLRYHSFIKKRNLEILAIPDSGEDEIIIIPSHENNRTFDKGNNELLIENQTVKVYRMHKK